MKRFMFGAGVFAALFAISIPGSTQERTMDVRVIGSLDLGGVGISTYKDLAFAYQAANEEGGGSVAIIDISNPANPVKIGETPRYPGAMGEESRAVKIGSRDVLIVSLGEGLGTPGTPGILILFDITDPAHPRKIGHYDATSLAYHFDVTKQGNRTLVLLSTIRSEALTSNFGQQPGLGDLQIIDVSDPANPIMVGEWGVLDEPSLGRIFFLREQRGARADDFGERVFASPDGKLAYYSYSDFGVIILDISDPTSPRFVGRVGYDEGEEGNALDVRPARGGRLLLRTHLVRFPFQIKIESNVYSGIRTAGEGDSTPPIYNLPDHTISGEVAFVGRGCESDSFLPDLQGKLALMTTEGCGLGNRMLRAQAAGAVGVIFFKGEPTAGFDSQFPPGVPGNSNLTIPAIGVGQNTGLCLAQLKDSNGNLLASDCSIASSGLPTINATSVFKGFGRLQVFDISDPQNPVKLSTIGTPNSMDVDKTLENRFPNTRRFFTSTHLEVLGNTAYVGWESDGLRIIDFSQPTNPREIGAWAGEDAASTDTPLRGWQVALHKGFILQSYLGYGFYIFKASPY